MCRLISPQCLSSEVTGIFNFSSFFYEFLVLSLSSRDYAAVPKKMNGKKIPPKNLRYLAFKFPKLTERNASVKMLYVKQGYKVKK